MSGIRKHRYNASCDSLHSYCPTLPMMFGYIPIDMVEDYGINGAKHIIGSTKMNLHSNYLYGVEESDAYVITKVRKI